MENKILQIGTQQLIPMNDCYRYTIQKVLPAKGYKFCFSIRKRSLDELIRRGIRLEVVFKEHPDLSFKYNPIDWRNKGKLKKEVHNFKDRPMEVYYFYVTFNGQITKFKQPEGQNLLI